MTLILTGNIAAQGGPQMTDTTRVSEAVARPVRTAIQAAPAAAITEFVDAFIYDLNDRQYGALLVLLTLVIAWVQAAYENSRGKALWFRKVGPTTSPVAGQ
jgi:hypothetical protein